MVVNTLPCYRSQTQIPQRDKNNVGKWMYLLCKYPVILIETIAIPSMGIFLMRHSLNLIPCQCSCRRTYRLSIPTNQTLECHHLTWLIRLVSVCSNILHFAHGLGFVSVPKSDPILTMISGNCNVLFRIYMTCVGRQCM